MKDLYRTFYVNKVINKGAYGCVYDGNRKSDEMPVAIKVIATKMVKNWVEVG